MRTTANRDHFSLDPGAKSFLEAIEDAPPMDSQTVEQNRARLAGGVPLTGPSTPGVTVQHHTIAGVPVRVYSQGESDGLQPATVYLHGGGWVTGDLNICDTTAQEIAAHSHATVVSVDYRLAPEHPFPAALDDALAVTRALLDRDTARECGIDASRVAVAGDSAGGNLAAVIAQELRDATPPIAHQVLVYPVMNLTTFDTASHREFAEGFNLTRRNLEYFYKHYVGTANPADTRISPGLTFNLQGVAGATIITAECDPLRDEGEAYGRALMEAGVPVTSVRFHGQVHPFIYFAGLIDAAHAARQLIGAELRRVFDSVSYS